MNIEVQNIEFDEDGYGVYSVTATVFIDGKRKDFYEFFDPFLGKIDTSCDSSFSIHPDAFDLSEFTTDKINEHELLEIVINKIESSEDFKNKAVIFCKEANSILMEEIKAHINKIEDELERSIIHITLDNTEEYIMNKFILSDDYDDILYFKARKLGIQDFLRDEQYFLSQSFSERVDKIYFKFLDSGLDIFENFNTQNIYKGDRLIFSNLSFKNLESEINKILLAAKV